MEGFIQQALEQQVLGAVQAAEDAVDDELHRLENLTEDDLEEIRRKRLEQMKRTANKRQEWLAKGHGEYKELLGEKEFFAEMKGEDRMVCHFFRNNWPCKVMDKHLGILASQHIETKFVKIDAEKSPFLTERLKIWMLPTLAVIKKEKTVDYVVGLDELGGTDDFNTETLRERLAATGVINLEGEAAQRARAEAGKGAAGRGGNHNLRQSTLNKTADDESSDFDD